MMRRSARVIPLVAGALLGACNALGPRAVEGTRVAYNEVLARTQAEQLLLNVVRLRYVDVPLFLEVSSVNTQFEFRSSADAGISGDLHDSLSEHGVDVGVGFSVVEKPTVSYVPLQGDAFVKQMMAPVDLDTVVLLTRAGWSAYRVLRVCAQSLSGLPNAPSAAGPAPDFEPDYVEFDRAVTLLRAHQRERVGGVDRDDAGAYVLRVDADAADTAELRALLGLPAGAVFPLRAGGRREPGVVSVETRSLLGAMFYLSQGVDLPAPHAAEGRAVTTPGAGWNAYMAGLFHVRSTAARPADAVVAVRYRGWWYSIDDSDISSKATFAMLSYLFAVQSGDRSTRGPALTIGL